MAEQPNAGLFETFPLEPQPDLPEFKSLIDIWNVTRGDALLPRWKDFSFNDLMPWIGRLAVNEFDGEEIHSILFGGAFVELFDREMTGKPFFASLIPTEHKLLHGHIMEVITGPCIGHFKGALPLYNRDHKQVSILALPLAENGCEVSHTMHAISFE